MQWFNAFERVSILLFSVLSREIIVLWLQVVEANDPVMVALHLQEVGGKDYEVSMPKVDSFVR